MKLDAILVRENPGEYESLVLALRAVARSAGVDLGYDALCAALGVSFCAASTPLLETPGWWMTYGRDAFLEEAAKLFGLTLRDLHPPDVGMNMAGTPDYPAHFEDSYRPLIVEALRNGQPVLAWQGWEGACAPFWGVLTRLDGDLLIGTTMWAEGRLVRLSAPASQCYVVEACDPYDPPPPSLFAAAIRHGEAYMNRAPFASPDDVTEPPPIVTGPAAFDAWEAWLQRDDFGDPAVDDRWAEHRQHAEFVAEARLSAARFLKTCRTLAGEDRVETIDEAVACCESLAKRLEPSRDEGTVRTLFGNSTGRRKLLDAINAAEGDDRRLAVRLEDLL